MRYICDVCGTDIKTGGITSEHNYLCSDCQPRGDYEYVVTSIKAEEKSPLYTCPFCGWENHDFHWGCSFGCEDETVNRTK